MNNLESKEKVLINIDTVGYSNKPESDFGFINNRVAGNIEELSLDDFADRVGNQGQAFTRALVNGARRKENFVQQKMLVLDFDQNKGNEISYDEFCDRCTEYNLPFAFTYKTFSFDGRNRYFKFRAVFFMNILITDVNFAEAVNILFQRIFPESDKACTDIPRMFYGGKGLINCNFGAGVDVSNIFFFQYSR